MLFFTDEELRGSIRKIVDDSSVNVAVSGGISGAITNEETVEAQKHAIKEYEKIRNDNYDIEKIVANTNFQELQIKIIKNYLFYDKHKREDGSVERFDPDFYIAQSWHTQNVAHNMTNEKFNYTDSAENTMLTYGLNNIESLKKLL